ncbi:hypothetical protein [Paracoccus sp. 22332]|uniref:hypothetical protein n=1 Tax=Paracoccus sp. 22332 TaxID=3453913 RepID=UPI003F826613
MDPLDYWKECISIAADEGGFELTTDQITQLAESVQGGHENYGMAYYSPPASDRLNAIEDEWKRKYAALEREFEQYRNGAEKAIKRTLPRSFYSDSSVSITSDGEVYRHDGRTTQVL